VLCGLSREKEELGYFNSLVGIHKFLSHVIKKVPASVGKRALKESQGDKANVRFLEILKCILWLQPEEFSCGQNGQEAAQRDKSRFSSPWLAPSSLSPLLWQYANSFVWFPVNPQKLDKKEQGNTGPGSPTAS
jgi:hypothetical protein